jgi:hypothetical protein
LLAHLDKASVVGPRQKLAFDVLLASIDGAAIEQSRSSPFFRLAPDSRAVRVFATHIVETKTDEFDPKKFQDQYEDAVKELLKRKQHGEKIEVPKERQPAKVVNLEALRQSIAAESGSRGKQRRAQCSTALGKKKAARSSARQRKAG